MILAPNVLTLSRAVLHVARAREMNDTPRMAANGAGAKNSIGSTDRVGRICVANLDARGREHIARGPTRQILIKKNSFHATEKRRVTPSLFFFRSDPPNEEARFEAWVWGQAFVLRYAQRRGSGTRGVWRRRGQNVETGHLCRTSPLPSTVGRRTESGDGPQLTASVDGGLRALV
jgi:hypothetical protein